MKKFLAVFLVLAMCLTLASCDLSIDENGGELVSNLTQLPTPTITEVRNNYVYWNEVPNASSYVIKINNYQESAGNALKYSISSIMDSRLDSDTPTELHIYVKAKGNQILYADSEWSLEYTYVYSKSGSSDSNRLTTPVFSYDPTNNVITWNAVVGADGYELNVNGESNVLPQMITCEYKPNVEPDVGFSFSMRALTPENDSSYLDSNWTRTTTLTYIPEWERVTNTEAISKARELGIGYAYNFISDVYFDVTNSSTNSVVDLDKLFQSAALKIQPSGYTKYGSIYEEKISDFQLSVAASLNSEVSAGGVFDIFSANVSAGLQSSTSIDFSKFNQSGFLNCYSHAEYKNYQVIDYGTAAELSGILSSNFLALINKQGVYSSLTDIEIANIILSSYGTHLVLGVKTGGRLDYYYSMATNNSKIALDFKNSVTASASGGIAGLISAAAKNSWSLELEGSLANNQTKKSSSFVIYGGSTDGITASNIEDKMISWSSSINESNARSIGVSKNGMVYLPTLISYLNRDLGETLDVLIQHNANEEYLELVSRFTTNDAYYGDGIDYTYIYSVEEFLEKIPKKLDGNFAIMYDLDFEGATLPSFGKFSGILRGYVNDGKNPILKNFKLSSTNQQYLGLFSELASGGIIRDIDVVNCSVSFCSDDKSYTEGALGVFAGVSYGLIDNCSVGNSTFNGYIYKFIGTSNAVKLHCGAITGWNAGGTITNCSSKNNQFVGNSNGGKTDGKVECNVGGITGMSTGKGLINKCESFSLSISITLRGGKTWTFTNVRLKGRAGGIVGYNGSDTSVLNCTASSNTSNYSFTLTKAESCNYDNLTSKGIIAGLNDGNIS